ncbi:WD-40 repeat-containing protein [Cyclospora cayetanensis]|uniref:WD-40 repeat-containing protein n=1 Tax=Cyclospora cayetanensis TaxID=88456 RepID=A0A1D3CWU8_9EIME|nr:WD-40 repeat-containing protein [Cyclospora cayetanensis]
MVKAYLNYKHAASFGLTATPSANLVLLPGVGPSFSSCSGDLVWCCCGSEAVLWHTQQRQQLLRLQPPPVMLPDGELEVYRQAATVVAPAAVAAAVAVGYSDGSIRPVTALLPLHATLALEAAAKEEADAEEDAIAATATAATAARDGETQQHAAPGKQRNNKRKAHSHVSQNSSDACNTTNSSVLLLSGSKDGLLKIWDVDLQLCLHTEVGAAEAGEVWTLAVNPCQTRLFVGGGDHKIRVFALHLGLHAAAASNASASEAAAAQITRAVTSGGSRIVDFYRCLNAEEQKRQQLKRERRAQQRLKKKQQQEEEEKGQQQHDQQQHDQQFSEMLYANGEDAFEHLTRFSSGGHAGQLRSLCTSHDDGYILSAADEGAKVWSASSSTVRCVKTLPCEEPQCGFVMAGNEHIVLGCRSGELLLFDLGSNELLQRTAAHAGAVNALAEHPKHTGFASASSDKTVKLFAFYISDELSEAHEKKKKKAGGGFSPKDQHQQISLRCEGSFNVPDEALDVAFHPVGNLLIVALIDHTILVLHADTAIEAFFAPAASVTGRIRLSLYGHKLPVTSVAVSSSGALLASGSVDKSLKIWGLDFGDIRKSFRAHEETVTKVAFLPLTHYVLTAGLDGFIKQWDADRHLLVKVYACGVSARGGCLGVAPTVIMERPTKLTDEALKTADKLIEALQVARQQREEDAEFATAFFRWVSALPRDGCRSSFEADPLPMPPAARGCVSLWYDSLNAFGSGPTEVAVRLALQLVQLHFRLIQRLRAVIRPLLQYQRDALRFNSAALGVLLRCVSSSSSEALHQLRDQQLLSLSSQMPPHDSVVNHTPQPREWEATPIQQQQQEL